MVFDDDPWFNLTPPHRLTDNCSFNFALSDGVSENAQHRMSDHSVKK